MANQHGLSRHIPEDVKRAVRVRCGFGCAFCGVTITEYEHFFPDFSDAEIHDPDQIVLLCPMHHGLVTKGVLPKDQVAAASLSPKAKSVGFSRLEHPWFTGLPNLKLGGNSIITGTPIPIRFGNEPVIKFDAPEEGSNVTRISANLRDASGKHFLRIIDNEWQVVDGSWDFQFIGSRYIFKGANREPMLILRMNAPDMIAIELLNTSINGTPLVITEEHVRIGTSIMTDCVSSDSYVGMQIG